MTPRPSPDGDPIAAVLGLSALLDAMGQRVTELEELPDAVHLLSGRIAELAERLAAAETAAAPKPASWLAPTEVCEKDEAFRKAASVLTDLAGWVRTVYLRYPDGAGGLPECWPWHPDAVEELLWLRTAWAVAYTGRAASALRVGDWHDRSRPGVARRIRAAVGTCSLENHGGAALGVAAVPSEGHIAAVAAWWALDRDGPPPAAEPCRGRVAGRLS
ncbi:MAG: hypothetical protein ACT4QF_23955 [Sporichthyaceae bacterium]